jgi:Na+/glutamate symporter
MDDYGPPVEVQLAKYPTRVREMGGAIVAGIGLIALVLVVAIALLTLPEDQRGANIVAIASSGFGVIGAIVGAYFGVRSANQAVQTVKEQARSDQARSDQALSDQREERVAERDTRRRRVDEQTGE